MLAAVVIASFGFILTLVVDVIRRDGAKIRAALQGRSWTARPTAGQPITVRFSPQRTEAVLEPKWQPRLRAAA